MKVLYVGNLDPKETGGTRRAYEVVRRVRKCGVEPYILHIKKVPDDPLTRVGALRSLKEIVVLSRLDKIKELIRNVDLVVATSESPSTALTAYRIARSLNKPWTVVMQSPIKLRYTPASTEPILVDPLWLPQEVQALHVLRKTIVLTVSPSCIVESSIKIPNYIVLRPGVGIDYEEFQKVEVDEKAYEAIFMARLTPEKGVFDLVKIWAHVVKEVPKARLAVAGRFKNYAVAYRFFDLVRRYGLHRNILYLGYLAGEEKVRALKRAEVFVYPSVLDSFGIVVLEALASGLPVIAYDIPAIRYNYPGNVVARVSAHETKKFAEKVIELIQSCNLHEISEKSKTFASRFTWDEVVKAEVEAYNKIAYSIIKI